MKILKWVVLFIGIGFITPKSILAQTSNSREIDSLKTLLNLTKQDTIKLNILSKLVELCEVEDNLLYAEPAVKIAEQNLKNLPTTDPYYYFYSKYLADALNGVGYFYHQKNDTVKAIDNYQKSIKIGESINGYQNLSTTLINLANLYESFGNYSKAESLYLEALKIKKNLESEEKYASSLNKLAVIYFNRKEYVKAELLLLQSVEIRKKTLGESHPYYAGSLKNLAELYRMMHNYAKAEPLFIQVIEILKKTLHENDPSYATTLNNLAKLYMATSNYAKAEPLYIQAIQIKKKTLGEANPSYATSLNNLALLYLEKGFYTKAEPLFLEALEIDRKALGLNDPSYAATLNNLATLYHAMGNYPKVELLSVQTLEIKKKSLGVNHPSYAITLNNLGEFYSEMGNYAKAEPLFAEAMEITKKVFGENHDEYATLLSNLGKLYSSIGIYSKAESLILEALDITKKVKGEKHASYALVLNNLAMVYSAMGNYTKAESLYIQALEIREKALGANDYGYAMSLNNLAELYRNMGNFTKAEPLYVQSYEISKKALGVNHPSVALTLYNLALLYDNMGKYSQAEPLLLQSIEIQKKVLGEEHPHYLFSISCLAVLYYKTGNYEKAQPLYIEASEISFQNIKQQFSFLSEKEQELYLKTLLVGFENINLFALKIKESNPSITSDVYNNLLKTKCVLLKSGTAMRNAVLSSKDDKLISTYNNWNSLKKQIANIYNLPIEKRTADLPKLESEANDLEKELTRSSSVLSDFNSSLNVNWKDIQTQLKPNEAAIEFTNFKFEYGESFGGIGSVVTKMGDYVMLQPTQGSPSQKAGLINGDVITKIEGHSIKGKSVEEVLPLLKGKANTSLEILVKRDGVKKPFEITIVRNEIKITKDKTLYCALIIKKDSEFPEMVQLFEEAQLANILSSLKENNNFAITSVYGSKRFTETKLYDVIWKPLEQYLKGIEIVNYSPSGLLHKVSFAALSNADGHYLIDGYKLNILTTTAMVAKPTQSVFDKNTRLTLFGGISYSIKDTTNLPWKYLEGTLSETEQLNNAFKKQDIKVNYIKAKDATKQKFKSLAVNSNIIHIATHGFIFPEPKFIKTDEKTENIDIVSRRASRAVELNYIRNDNPLMRSGLVLAGVNDYWNGITDDIDSNGILTALEVVNIDLRKNKLVVLSACETGLGDIRGGEGVYGLQRAFKMAGTENIIMSLWQVPDKETSEFMQIFYELLFSKQNINQAFTETQNLMRKKYNPFYWAAFVLVR